MTRFKRGGAHSSVVLTNIRPPFFSVDHKLETWVCLCAYWGCCTTLCYYGGELMQFGYRWCLGICTSSLPPTPTPTHPSLTMDASARMTFLFCFFFIFRQRQNSSMKWIIISETSNCKTTNGLTFFWLFKGKRFCLIKLYKDGTGLFWKGFYLKRTKNSVKL